MISNKLRKLVSVGLIAASVLSCGFLEGCSKKHVANQVNNVVSSMESKGHSKYVDAGNSQAETPANTVPVEAVRVVDGDTAVVKYKGENLKIRFLLIDTPETCKPNTPVEPYGPEAKAFTKRAMQPGSELRVEFGKAKKDKYGRGLGFIYYKQEGRWFMLNEMLVKNGLARVAYVYKDKEHLDELYKCQDVAKKDKKGIWSIPGYVTDKGYNLKVVKR